jgi:hypothetical protein
MVLERETGLEEVAETGVMIHGDVSADLLLTIFTPRSPLHDGAVIIREGRVVAAGALLPLAEMSIHTERFGTRHRAALGITEQTDAVVVVVSEENGQISLVERARIVRNLTEAGLARAIQGLLDPAGGRRGALVWRSASQAGSLAGRSPRIRELGRFVRRPAEGRGSPSATAGRHRWQRLRERERFTSGFGIESTRPDGGSRFVRSGRPALDVDGPGALAARPRAGGIPPRRRTAQVG